MTGDNGLETSVDRVADLLGAQIGLRPQSTLRGRLRRCIQDEAAAQGRGVDDYVDEIAARRGAFQSLVNHLTVQESGFFRHPGHFDVLARDILPVLARPVRIWSAGCGNGQEAFSLAMILAELHVEGTVFATDLSTDALARTIRATYTTREVAGLSPARITQHLSKTGQGWTVNADLRARVVTAQHNLIDALPDPARSCQVIFCRNVLIYFSPHHTRTFLDRIADDIPAAVVLLGAAETMWSSSDRFRTVQAGDSYYYRPRGAAVVRLQPSSSSAYGADNTRAVVRMPTPSPKTRPAGGHPEEAAALAVAGQLALDIGDHRLAVVSFRKCVYLAPEDTLAHLHLGFALEASGDRSSARRAYATARRTMLQSASRPLENSLGGYATDELLRLLDTKHLELAP